MILFIFSHCLSCLAFSLFLLSLKHRKAKPGNFVHQLLCLDSRYLKVTEVPKLFVKYIHFLTFPQK